MDPKGQKHQLSTKLWKDLENDFVLLTMKGKTRTTPLQVALDFFHDLWLKREMLAKWNFDVNVTFWRLSVR